MNPVINQAIQRLVDRRASDMAHDPAALMRAAGLEPDAWQASLLRSTSRQVLLNCCRQSGKSTTSAAIALHTALYVAGALVLLLSPTLRQSAELFKKVIWFYRALGRPVEPEIENRLSLELTNGSRIVSLPGEESNIRGYSGVNLLLIDEAARVHDDLYYAVRPMLAVSGGRLILMSTPFGKRGAFFDAWHVADPSWERIKVTALDCPRISPAFLEEERLSMGEWWFKQEYLCEFGDNIASVFAYDDIMAALSPTVRPLFDLAPAVPDDTITGSIKPMFQGAL